jgi:hypothetical protein
MPDQQPNLFPEPAAKPASAEPTKNCIRCGIRCRVVAAKNPDASLFVKGTMKTGRFCANCLMVDFLVNCDTGPRLETVKPPYWDNLPNKPPWKGFDPECLRAPHIQDQMMTIIAVAQKQYGAELTIIEVDWDEVIANWHLPFPENPAKGRKKSE